MAWQKTADSKAVVIGENGNPIWVTEDDKKSPVEVDWGGALQTIARINAENKERREAAEALTTDNAGLKKLIEAYGEIDPAKAKDAIKKLESIDQGSLLTADKVEQFKTSILQAANSEKERVVKEYDTKVNELTGAVDKKEKEIYKLVISNAFANSAFVKTLVAPVAMVESYFQHCFKIEEGKPIGFLNGNPIHSRKRPGEKASFEEAIQIVIDEHPDKNKLLPGTGGGSGAQGGGNRGGQLSGEAIKNMPLAEYEKAKKEGRIAPIG